MMELSYRTRGNSNPFGKAKVYFSCHPADFEAYFDVLSDEILEREDCAVWYDNSQSEPENPEEFLQALSGMRLFVIPVTKAFLTKANRARDLEFHYALEQKIPVLPLLQEKGLEELFNETCGELQLVDLRSKEIVSFLYEDRLEHYLSRILAGDTLTQRVRAAFRAHIFLSYRKQDQAYARKLMSLIHETDICRDAAVWYDEYLTGGENFSTGIQTAIQTCDLFVMAVTPNLLTEDNYVMTTEYPLALQEKKAILPIVIQETDTLELQEKYPGIPSCVPAADKEALTGALEKHLRQLPKEPENSPQHDYLIGYAFLSGIDTEVNKQKGIALITAAARAGLPEAMEHLANLYLMGDGTKRDYNAALAWSEQLVIAEGKAYYENRRLPRLDAAPALPPDSAAASKCSDNYLSALLSFAENCQSVLGDLTSAENAYLKMEEILAQRHTRQLNAPLLQTIVFAALGDLCIAKGELLSAYEYYSQADSAMEILSAGESFPPFGRTQLSALIYQNLGFICRKLKRYPEAWEYLQKARSIMESLVSKTGENEDRQALAEIYMGLGALCELQHNLTDAHQHYYNCLSISESIAKEANASAAEWLLLAAAYEKMGNVCQKEGGFTQVERCYDFSLAIHDSAETETTGSVTDKQHLGNLCMTYGVLAKEQENYQKAQELLSKSLTIHTSLWETSGLSQSRNALALLYYYLGCLGDGNLHYLELACQLLDEQAWETANSGMSMGAAISSIRQLKIIKKDAKKRIKAMKRRAKHEFH